MKNFILFFFTLIALNSFGAGLTVSSLDGVSTNQNVYNSSGVLVGQIGNGVFYDTSGNNISLNTRSKVANGNDLTPSLDWGNRLGSGNWSFPNASVLNATNASGTGTAVATTNFLTRNCLFVDAGNGSDLNSGSVNQPWATIQHAQTNTPAGWTLCFAPGTYAGTLTNGAINYYFSPGSIVTVADFNNANSTIKGFGNVSFANINGWSNVVLNVNCSVAQISISFDGYLFLTNDSDSGLIEVQNLNEPTNYGVVNITSKTFEYQGAPLGSATVSMMIFCSQQLSFNDEDSSTLSTNSIFSSPLGIVLNDFGGLSYSSIKWGIGYMDMNADPDSGGGLTLSGCRLLNDPMFSADAFSTIQNCIGSYQK